MDITKVSADILDGPNWCTWAVQIQAAARVLNCWSVIKGERIPGITLPTYDLIAKPVQGTGTRQISDAALFVKSLFEWNKMNLTALGLIKGKVEPSTCGPTTLMSEMPQSSGLVWKPSMEKQEELIPTCSSSERSNRHSTTPQIFCHRYRSSKKIVNTYYPMVTLILQRTLWFSCSVPPSPTHTKIPHANIVKLE